MITRKEIAHQVAQVAPMTADRYDQIAVIKRQLRDKGYKLLSTDRETIDGILDILFYEYGYQA